MVDCRPDPKVYHPVNLFALQNSFRRIDAVGRELLAVRAQVCGWKSKTTPKVLPFLDCAENRVISPQHLFHRREIARLDRFSDGGAADRRAS